MSSWHIGVILHDWICNKALIWMSHTLWVLKFPVNWFFGHFFLGRYNQLVMWLASVVDTVNRARHAYCVTSACAGAAILMTACGHLPRDLLQHNCYTICQPLRCTCHNFGPPILCQHTSQHTNTWALLFSSYEEIPRMSESQTCTHLHTRVHCGTQNARKGTQSFTYP